MAIVNFTRGWRISCCERTLDPRPPATLEDRPSDLTGFAVAVLRIGDLVDASLRAAGAKRNAVTITDNAENDVIYRQSETAAVGKDDWSTEFDIAGKREKKDK